MPIALNRVSWAICLLLATLPPALAAKKTEAAKENLKEVHEKIESLKKELDASQDAHKDATDALKDSEKAISLAQKKLHEINLQQKRNSAKLNKLEKKSGAINQKLLEQQQKLSQQLYQQYLHGNQSYTQLILENKDPNVIARDLKYYSYIAKARGQLIADMQGNLNEIQLLNQDTALTLQEVEALKAKQEAEKAALDKQKQEKAKIVSSLSKKIAAQRNEINKLKRDEKNLTGLIERLSKAAKTTKKSKPKVPIHLGDKSSSQDKTQSANNTVIAKNEATPDNSDAGLHFASLRGKLRLPVRGEVTNRFGASRSDTGLSWKGLFIRASEGQEVKSVASGKIVFADWMRGFGNLMIVDHGSGYLSLYGNNQALLKNVGQAVEAGESIATVGNSGGNESNGLYYELRKNSVPFDPLKWSALR